MEFVWDEAKSRTNYAKHGLDFRDAEKVFQGMVLTAEDNRQDYGETRFISVGLLDDVPVVVVYTERGAKIRLISMRKANQKERRAYEEKISFGLAAPPELAG
jgi:uncharacterized protein